MVAPRFLLCWYMLVNGFALLLVESAADRRQQVETGSSVWTRTSAPQFGRRQALHPGSSLSPPRRMTCCLESPSNWLRNNNNSHKDSLQDSATFSIPRGGRRRVPHPQRWWNSLNFTGGRSMEQSSLSLVRLLLARLPRSGWITAAVATVAIVLGQRVVSSPAVRRAAYFWWHAGPIVAHYQWTHFWLQHVRRNTTTPAQRDHMYQQLHDRYAEPSLQLILHLQGLYCKLGQVLSTRPDFVPPQYITRFSTVQDAIPQWPIDRIEKIVRDALQEHFNLAYEDVFQHMDAVALGSASIGQVHAATLTPEWADRLERSDTTANNHNNHKMRKHNYTRVAVKVMHPGAKQRFAHDCQVVRWLCRVAMPGWSQILDSFERRLMLEFDYCREARDMQEIRTNLLASPYNASIVCVPHPELQLCCPNVLVMELLDGTKLVNAIENGLTRAMGGDEKKAAAFLKEQQDQILWGDMKKNHQEDEEDDPVSGLAAIPVGGGGGDPPRRRRRGRHGGLKVLLHSYGLVSVLKLGFLQRRYQKLVRLLLGVHGYQMFINGCYNGDPHPGNCLELVDGRIGLIDYGQVRRLSDEDRLTAARIVCALAKNDGDAVVAEHMRDFGFETKDNRDDETMACFARLFFDSDYESKALGFATPQLWFAHLMARNALVNIPDAAMFVGRSSFLFRGLAKGIQMPPIRTAVYWEEHAQQAIQELSRNNHKTHGGKGRNSQKT